MPTSTLSILRIPKSAPINLIVRFVKDSCLDPVNGQMTFIDYMSEYVLEIRGLRPDHPQIQGGFCDCTGPFCPRCLGQGWVAYWCAPTPELVQWAARSLIEALHGV